MCKPWGVVEGSAASPSFTGCSLSQCFARATKFSVKCLSSRSLQSKFYLKSKEAELVGKPTVMALTAAPAAMQCGLSRGQATAIGVSKFQLCNPNFNSCPLLTSINGILSVDTQSQGLWIHVSFIGLLRGSQVFKEMSMLLLYQLYPVFWGLFVSCQ